MKISKIPGNYFGSHFIMGGERFDTPTPENYLFGENSDLNFLGCKPVNVSSDPRPQFKDPAVKILCFIPKPNQLKTRSFQFPYSPPNATEPTKTLKSLVNIRKESVKFVKSSQGQNKTNSFNIEFIFDADAKCAITIYYFCVEEISTTGVTYLPRDPSLTSETYHYPKGANQVFFQPSHIFNPQMFSDEDLLFNSEKDAFPVVIHCCVVDEGLENSESRQSSMTTICVIDHHSSDGTFVLRALKQKIFVDGLCYLLQVRHLQKF